jgi:hypothetical protein
MIKTFKERKIIFLKDLKGFSSIVNTNYRVLGLWSQTQKKLATKAMQKKPWKEDVYFLKSLGKTKKWHSV